MPQVCYGHLLIPLALYPVQGRRQNGSSGRKARPGESKFLPAAAEPKRVRVGATVQTHVSRRPCARAPVASQSRIVWLTRIYTWVTSLATAVVVLSTPRPSFPCEGRIVPWQLVSGNEAMNTV